MNLYANAAGPGSTTTTPGKLHPPSPLYYDYTEDFDIDDYNQPEPLPPPTFRMAQSIPEDEPASLNSPVTTTPLSESKIPVATSRPAFRSSASATSGLQRSLGSNVSQGTRETNISASSPLNVREETPEEEVNIELVDSKRNTKVIGLSGVGQVARELSTHVEEAFGLPSSSSFEFQTPDEFKDANESQSSADDETSILRSGFDRLSTRSSALSLSTNLQQFPRPPGHQETFSSNDIVHEEPDNIGEPLDTRAHLSRSSASVQRPHMESHPEDSYPLPRKRSRGRERASMVDSLDMGVEELDKLILPPFGGTNILQSLPNGSPSGSRPDRLSKMSKIPSEQKERDGQESNHQQFRAQYDGARSESSTAQPQNQAHPNETVPKEETISMQKKLDIGNVPNLSRGIPSQLVPRSELPMIAPKPISPARQLRLRNSIPQIMKALPPLPQDPPDRAGLLMDRLPSFEPEHQLSPNLVEATITMREPQKTPQLPLPHAHDKDSIPEKSPVRHTAKPEVKTSLVEERKSGAEEATTSAPPLPRLKLKTRASSSRPLSPPDARPWNMEDSYPWSNQNLNVELPPINADEKPLLPALPKFKLKVTRASNSGSQGTMIVNRESTELKETGAINLRTPKDLFTPASGLENIFRQVGKHLHTRTSESIYRSETDFPPLSNPHAVLKEPVVTEDEQVIKFETQLMPFPVTPAGDVAQSSFSDDSSHIDTRHKLRTRLSNLKARLPFNYGYRAAAHSSDDVVWERQSEDPRTPHVLQSAPNLHSARATFSGRPQRKISDKVQQGSRLRGKVRGWLKGAKTAIVGHKRSRSSLSKKSDDERAHLTVFD